MMSMDEEERKIMLSIVRTIALAIKFTDRL